MCVKLRLPILFTHQRVPPTSCNTLVVHLTYFTPTPSVRTPRILPQLACSYLALSVLLLDSMLLHRHL